MGSYIKDIANQVTTLNNRPALVDSVRKYWQSSPDSIRMFQNNYVNVLLRRNIKPTGVWDKDTEDAFLQYMEKPNYYNQQLEKIKAKAIREITQPVAVRTTATGIGSGNSLIEAGSGLSQQTISGITKDAKVSNDIAKEVSNTVATGLLLGGLSEVAPIVSSAPPLQNQAGKTVFPFIKAAFPTVWGTLWGGIGARQDYTKTQHAFDSEEDSVDLSNFFNKVNPIDERYLRDSRGGNGSAHDGSPAFDISTAAGLGGPLIYAAMDGKPIKKIGDFFKGTFSKEKFKYGGVANNIVGLGVNAGIRMIGEGYRNDLPGAIFNSKATNNGLNFVYDEKTGNYHVLSKGKNSGFSDRVAFSEIDELTGLPRLNYDALKDNFVFIPNKNGMDVGVDTSNDSFIDFGDGNKIDINQLKGDYYLLDNNGNYHRISFDAVPEDRRKLLKDKARLVMSDGTPKAQEVKTDVPQVKAPVQPQVYPNAQPDGQPAPTGAKEVLYNKRPPNMNRSVGQRDSL